MKSELEAHLRSVVNFPSPPGVAIRIIEISRDPDIELAKVAKALSHDSALATKILRIANSPLYAQRRKSDNLRQALVVLGLNATLTLALCFSLVKSLRSSPSNGIDHPRYWRRALLAATSARALADALRHPLSEEIFLAALLQDVGILALDQAVPDLYRNSEAAQRDHATLARMESMRLQTDHAEVGGWLMRLWNLPERLHQAISRSHQLDLEFSVDPARIFERCVALSGPVADLFLLDRAERQFAETALDIERSLGLDKMAFGQVIATVGAMIPETEALFESESLAAQHPEVIVEQARDVLMLRSLNSLRELAAVRANTASPSAPPLELEEETRRDPLTGVYQRAYFDHVLLREFENASTHQWPLSIAFANLDDFQAINERFGQTAADRILKSAARLLRGQTRTSDLICRFGGEEFVILLPATDAATARSLCDRIVSTFEETEHLIGPERARVAISIGCVTQGRDTQFVGAREFLDAAIEAAHARRRSCSASRF